MVSTTSYTQLRRTYDAILQILQVVLRQVPVQAVLREVRQQDSTRTAEPAALTVLTVLTVLAMVTRMIVAAVARGALCEVLIRRCVVRLSLCMTSNRGTNRDVSIYCGWLVSTRTLELRTLSSSLLLLPATGAGDHTVDWTLRNRAFSALSAVRRIHAWRRPGALVQVWHTRPCSRARNYRRRIRCDYDVSLEHIRTR